MPTITESVRKNENIHSSRSKYSMAINLYKITIEIKSNCWCILALYSIQRCVQEFSNVGDEKLWNSKYQWKYILLHSKWWNAPPPPFWTGDCFSTNVTIIEVWVLPGVSYKSCLYLMHMSLRGNSDAQSSRSEDTAVIEHTSPSTLKYIYIMHTNTDTATAYC